MGTLERLCFLRHYQARSVIILHCARSAAAYHVTGAVRRFVQERELVVSNGSAVASAMRPAEDSTAAEE